MVDVIVSGAIVRMGHHLLKIPATIAAALEAAGGLARQPQMWPAGPITVREWESFALQTGDLIVVQWQVADAEPGAAADGGGM